MNLDGLINSWDFKERFFDRDRIYEFITVERPVDYVCQYVTLGDFDGRHIRGTDFRRRGWNVVYEDAVEFRSVLRPWRSRVDVFLVLTRRRGGQPFDRVSELLTRPHPVLPRANGELMSAVLGRKPLAVK